MDVSLKRGPVYSIICQRNGVNFEIKSVKIPSIGRYHYMKQFSVLEGSNHYEQQIQNIKENYDTNNENNEYVEVHLFGVYNKCRTNQRHLNKINCACVSIKTRVITIVFVFLAGL